MTAGRNGSVSASAAGSDAERPDEPSRVLESTLDPDGDSSGECEFVVDADGSVAAAAVGETGPSRTPVLYYIVLGASLLAISCAGTLLRKLATTPPFLKGFWRLFFISWALGIGFVVQYRRASDEVRRAFCTARTQLILACTGVVTSIHFASWIWSLQQTSLAHSLFFVCAHPLLVVLVMLAQGVRVNRWEAVGVAVGLVGSTLMLLDASNDSGDADDGSASGVGASGAIKVTWQGDLVAFTGAVAMVGYLYAGKHCRSWLPLFLYAFPVTLIASLPMLALSLATEEVTWSGLGMNSVFGFLGPAAIGLMLLILIGPGLTGHLGISFVLSHISPLAVSIVITVEPVIGVVIGILAGVESLPHALTLIGGPATLVGCLFAVYGTYVREQRDGGDGAASGVPTSSAISSRHRHRALPQQDSSLSSEVELVDLDWTDDDEHDAQIVFDDVENGVGASSSTFAFASSRPASKSSTPKRPSALPRTSPSSSTTAALVANADAAEQQLLAALEDDSDSFGLANGAAATADDLPDAAALEQLLALEHDLGANAAEHVKYL